MSTTQVLGMVLPGFATGIGAYSLYLIRRPSPLTLDVLLGFAAGVMLAATSFSLLVPALDTGGLGEVIAGFAAGAVAIGVVDRLMPHIHQRFVTHDLPAERAKLDQRGWMIVGALTIHNIPEGMAVGVAFAAGGTDIGVPLAIAIGVQNIPEGAAGAVPLLAAGRSKLQATTASFGSGLVEPVAALGAFGVVELAGGLLAEGLAFSAAAMLYVVVNELIPEAQARGRHRITSGALLIGFTLMLTLDNAFG